MHRQTQILRSANAAACFYSGSDTPPQCPDLLPPYRTGERQIAAY